MKTLLAILFFLVGSLTLQAQEVIATLSHNIKNELYVAWMDPWPNEARPYAGSTIHVQWYESQFSAKVLYCTRETIVIDADPGEIPVGTWAYIRWTVKPKVKCKDFTYTWLDWTAQQISPKKILIRNRDTKERLVLWKPSSMSLGNFQTQAVTITNRLP